jgi:hypothetical protein
MVKLLQRAYAYKIGSDLMVYEDPAGEHNERSWARHMPRVLEFFVKNEDRSTSVVYRKKVDTPLHPGLQIDNATAKENRSSIEGGTQGQ